MDPIIAGTIVLVCGALWAILGITISAENNFQSKLVFNIFPFISGTSCIIIGLKLLAII